MQGKFNLVEHVELVDRDERHIYMFHTVKKHQRPRDKLCVSAPLR